MGASDHRRHHELWRPEPQGLRVCLRYSTWFSVGLDMSDLEAAEREQLLEIPAFRKHLFRLIQTAGILSGTTNGADGRNLVIEGRRNLGLDILRDVSRGIPCDDPEAALNLLLIQVLREGAQSTPQEKTRGKRSRLSDLDEQEDDRT